MNDIERQFVAIAELDLTAGCAPESSSGFAFIGGRFYVFVAATSDLAALSKVKECLQSSRAVWRSIRITSTAPALNVTLAQAAVLTGQSVSTITKLVAAGRIPTSFSHEGDTQVAVADLLPLAGGELAPGVMARLVSTRRDLPVQVTRVDGDQLTVYVPDTAQTVRVPRVVLAL